MSIPPIPYPESHRDERTEQQKRAQEKICPVFEGKTCGKKSQESSQVHRSYIRKKVIFLAERSQDRRISAFGPNKRATRALGWDLDYHCLVPRFILPGTPSINLKICVIDHN